MEEKVLIARAKAQDKRALETLIKLNYPIVKGYLLKITFNSALTDDITQETMLKAILSFKNYREEGKFSTWLITIATNLYRDYLRKNKRLTDFDDESNFEVHNTSQEGSIDDLVIDKLLFKEIVVKLRQLPEEKRMELVLKHYHGYKYEEIGEIMKCPIGTVRSRIHDGLKFMRTQLTKEGGVNEKV